MRRSLPLLLGSVAALLLAALPGCGLGDSDGPRIPAGPSLIGIGDSYVSGVGLPHELWITTVGRSTQRAVLNLGIAGTLSRDAQRVADLVQPQAKDAVVISTGLNDLRTHGQDRRRLTDYADHLGEAIDAVEGAGCVVVLPPMPLLAWQLYPPTDKGSAGAVVAYQLAADEVARARGARVADAALSWNPTTMLSQDQAHPNALGDATLAASVARALQGCPRG